MQDPTTYRVANRELPNPQNSPFYTASEKASGLMGVIYPAYTPSLNAPANFAMSHSSFFTPQNNQNNIFTENSVTDQFKESYHILTFGGNGYQEPTVFRDSKSVANNTNAYVHHINMPGVNGDTIFSTGPLNNAPDCIKAAILQAEFLIDNGVAPEKIILLGTSLGGAIATIAAAHLHSEGKMVSVFNDRSFSTLSTVVNGMIPEKILKYIATPITAGFIAYRAISARTLPTFATFMPAVYVLAAYAAINIAIKAVLRTTHCEMNAADAYLSIPKYFKRLSYAINDEVLTNSGGLFNVDHPNSGSGRSFAYGLGDGGHNLNNGDMYGQNINNSRVSILDDFQFFVKEVKVRNSVRNYVLQYLNNAEIDKNSLPELLKNEKINEAIKKAEAEMKALKEQFKAEKNKSKFMKGLTAVFQSLRNAIRSVICLVYNLHEAKDQDKYLRNVDALAEKLIEKTVEQLMDQLEQLPNAFQSITNNSQMYNIDNSAGLLQSFTDTLRNEVCTTQVR